MITLPLKHFEVYDEIEVRRLNGGPIRGRNYNVVTIEGSVIMNVYFGQLRHNFQSRKSNSSYPDGYLPFQFSHGPFSRNGKYDFATKTLEFRKRWPGQSFFTLE